MRHILSVWEDVAGKLKAADHILFLSDFDGTLAPLAERPEDVRFPQRIRHHLAALVKAPCYTVGVISGRALAEVQPIVNLAGIYYAGNHGLEIEGPGLSFVHPEAQKLVPALGETNRKLHDALKNIEGVFIENKSLSLSVHYRRVGEEEVERVKELVHRVLEVPHFGSIVKLTEGKKIYEVRPAVEWNKGNAVEVVLDYCIISKGSKRILPIFLGDDTTDEDGFRAVERHGGISVVVAEHKRDTAAANLLRSPREVQKWLGLLVAEL